MAPLASAATCEVVRSPIWVGVRAPSSVAVSPLTWVVVRTPSWAAVRAETRVSMAASWVAVRAVT